MQQNLDLFLTKIRSSIPAKSILQDPLSRHAYGHDASHYLLIPQAVVRVKNETEVRAVLAAANACLIPITFRAAGTSLSGQALTDSVLVVLDAGWREYEILEEGQAIRLQAGVLGGEANLYLAPYRRKIGPDPASINSAKIGGIAANNASGMCCGTLHNSYHTLQSIRIIFSDGSLLDTRDPESVTHFRTSHTAWLAGLSAMRQQILQDTDLAARIRRKYAIKNTVGYSLNAFLDFADPIDILAHLMIGSEGTLGFITEVCYHTLPDPPYKKLALFYFDSIRSAMVATQLLKTSKAAAIELMDGLSLVCAQAQLAPFLPPDFNGNEAALLIDVRADTPAALQQMIDEIHHTLLGFQGLGYHIDFVEGESYRKIWQIRQGFFTLIATLREPGTLVLIEDVAVPIEVLPEATHDLRQLFNQYGFAKTSLFGHARDGNLHFVMTLRFDDESSIARYGALMNDLAVLIAQKYQGSLKAEHGTGRNMAPFVEYEWGHTAYKIMQDLKKLLDPHQVLNPEVILTTDSKLHLKHFKQVPQVDPLIDQCLECGFCEKVCPSRDLSLTPRQRIVGLRSMKQLEKVRPVEYRALLKEFVYRGDTTCAATGMCQTVCPVGINTGAIIQKWRATHLARGKRHVWGIIARYHALSLQSLRLLRFCIKAAAPARKTRPPFKAVTPATRKVVLFPSCSCRMLENLKKPEALVGKIQLILAHLGYDVIYPDFKNECCGLMYTSAGRPDLAAQKQARLFKALHSASEGGVLPILTENASCALELKTQGFALKIEDALHFLAVALEDYPLKQFKRSIMLHVNCSVTRLQEQSAIIALAKRCAREVLIPPDIYCCGFAGGKGFTHPELNRAALNTLKMQIPARCKEGYTCLQTCAIGLSKQAEIPYYALLDLVIEALPGNDLF